MKSISTERLFETIPFLADIIQFQVDFETFEEIEIYELILIEIDFIIVEVEIDQQINYEMIDVILIFLIQIEVQWT